MPLRRSPLCRDGEPQVPAVRIKTTFGETAYISQNVLIQVCSEAYTVTVNGVVDGSCAKLRVCQVRHIPGNVNASLDLDQCIDSPTDQRYTVGCSAELRSRMAEKTSLQQNHRIFNLIAMDASHSRYVNC